MKALNINQRSRYHHNPNYLKKQFGYDPKMIADRAQIYRFNTKRTLPLLNQFQFSSFDLVALREHFLMIMDNCATPLLHWEPELLRLQITTHAYTHCPKLSPRGLSLYKLVYLSTIKVPWVAEGLSPYMGEEPLMSFENEYLSLDGQHTK